MPVEEIFPIVKPETMVIALRATAKLSGKETSKEDNAADNPHILMSPRGKGTSLNDAVSPTSTPHCRTTSWR